MKMSKKRSVLRVGFVAALCAIASLVVAACGGGGGGGDTGSSSGGGGDEGLTIGYVAYSMATTPQQELKKGEEEAAKKYGYKVEVADPGGEPAKAVSLMQNFVTQGVDAIIVDSYGPGDLRAGLIAAKEAEIPVYMALAPGETDEAAYAVRANAGTAETEKMLENLGKEGSVLALTLPSGANCVSSQEQFEEIMEGEPGWEVREQPVKVPGFAQEASSTTKAWLKSHPASEKLAVWGCWDGPSIGAATALTEEGRNDVQVYGQNTEATTISLLEKGQYTASWWFDGVKLGQKMVELIHGDAGTPYDELEPRFESFPGIEVNQENVKQFVKEHPSVVSG
jgi:ribose transport system substrate-binding protein